MHNYSNMPNIQMVINTCQILLFFEISLAKWPLFHDFANSRLSLKMYSFRENWYERGVRCVCVYGGGGGGGGGIISPRHGLSPACIQATILGRCWIVWQMDPVKYMEIVWILEKPFFAILKLA